MTGPILSAEHITKCVSENACSSCGVSMHSGLAYGQRGANAQPFGSFVGSGIRPGIGFSSAVRFSMSGRELNNPSV